MLFKVSFLVTFHRTVGVKLQEVTYALDDLENLDLDRLEQAAIQELDEVSDLFLFAFTSFSRIPFILFYIGLKERNLMIFTYEKLFRTG